ncbi:MAG: STAS domain-containing protein [Bacilli bacterium]|nr:STAS domain-containing protein [Bacilli bacterium]MDY6392063.1 STAS domain-containing protein [Bacilli bacterium]
MEITKNMEGAVLHVALAGRLDTLTSNDLSTALEEESGFTDIIFDFAALEYLSSSGLRLLFTYQKKLGGKEHVIVRNANAVVREIFRVTGFARQVTLE